MKAELKVAFFCFKLTIMCMGAYYLFRIFMPNTIVPYVANMLGEDSGSAERQEFIQLLCAGVSNSIGFCSALPLVKKYIIGHKPRLIEERMQIKTSLIHKVSDIPDMLCVSFKEKEKKTVGKLKGERFEIYKAEISLELQGVGDYHINEISAYMIWSIVLSTTEEQNWYKYKEGTLYTSKRPVKRDEIEVKVIPRFYERCVGEGKIYVKAFLFIPRKRYAERYGLEHTGKLFTTSEDELSVKVRVIWINEQGCPYFKTYYKKLKQDRTSEGNIYWKSQQ